jgi:predicted nucleotidyltransferase
MDAAPRSDLERIKEVEIRPLLDRIRQVVRKYLQDRAYRVLLFGSWATLSSHPASDDIDIGILGLAPVDDLVIARIRDKIEQLPTLRKIEVVDLRHVEPRFREAAQQQAELLT